MAGWLGREKVQGVDMKPAKVMIGMSVLVLSVLSGSAWARVWVDVGIPFPLFYPFYPPPPVVAVPAYPPVVAVPAAPPVYVERGAAAPAAGPQGSYWYYCTNPPGYYPYVSNCPSGWLTVVPQSPPRR
jgi:hypothetical protein